MSILIKVARRLEWRILALALLVIIFSSAQAAEVPTKKVLFLYSSSSDIPVHGLFTRGFQKRMEQTSASKIEYMYEFLDLARYTDDSDYNAVLSHFLKEKYAVNRPDLIVTHLEPAANFMITYGDKILPGVPAVLGQYEGEGEKYPEPLENYFDVVGTYGIQKAVSLIIQAQPDTKKIYVVAGDSERERKGVAALAQETSEFTDRVEFIYLNKLPFDQILEMAKSIGDNSVILFLYFFRDAAGTVFVPGDALQRIHEVARVPIYSSVSVFIGLGTVGGYMSSQELLGSKAAEVGRDILQGKMDSHLQMEKMVAAEYIFDWRELKRWGIDERRLPAGSRIEFRQPSAWDTYRWQIASGVLLILCLVAVIGALLVSRRRRRQNQEALRILNESLEQTVAERTAELQEINATLEEEVFERQAAQAALGELNAALENKVLERTAELQEMNATLEEEIGERQIAQEGLQKFRLFFVNSRDILLFVSHTDGSILEANPAAEATYGFSREELLKKTIFDLRASAVPKTVEEQMHTAAFGGIVFETLHR